MVRNICRLVGLLLAGVATLLLTTVASAQEAEDSALAADMIIVTGTRNAERTAFDSLAPIDVVGSESIDETTSEDLLDSIAQTVPSFKVQRLPMNDGLIFVRPGTLRGLSPDQTLVLVNGKRLHRSALLGFSGAQAPDLATIPSFAIKRIEVLRDGASAQYGSDAIAGVINIILDDEPGFRGFSQYGQYYKNDGDNFRAGVQGGVSLGDRGFLVGTFEYFNTERTSRSRQRPDAIEFQRDNPDLKVRNPVQNWGQPEREGFRFAWNAEYGIDDTTDVYFFGTYGEGEGLSDFNWRNPESEVFGPSKAFSDFDLKTIYPAGFTPQFGQEDQDLSLVGGIRGDIADGALTWDVSASIGRNTIDYLIFNTINASLGPDSPTSFRPGILEQRELNFNADFVYLWELGFLASPTNLAFGVERREETYEKVKSADEASYKVGPGAKDELQTGSNGFRGFSPQEAGEFNQVSHAGYVDLELPLTDRWTVGLAGRYEDFSQFGDSWNGKVSTRYEIADGLAIRATASTGFRAPTPGQLFSETTAVNLDTVTLEVFTRGRFSPKGQIADIINARPDASIMSLKPEKAENYTIGFSYRSNFGLSATVDLYQIEVTDRFGESPNFTLTKAERGALAAAGVPGGSTFSSVNFFQNDFDTRTRGIDIVALYGVDVGIGELSFTAAYNFNDTKVTGGELANNQLERMLLEDRLPRHTANFASTYRIGDFELFGRLRYYGSWTDRADNANSRIFQKFGSEIFFDIAATYDVTDNLTVRAGAENVFNHYPAEASFQANRGLIYSRNAPYDTDGGNYYIRLDFDF